MNTIGHTPWLTNWLTLTIEYGSRPIWRQCRVTKPCIWHVLTKWEQGDKLICGHSLTKMREQISKTLPQFNYIKGTNEWNVAMNKWEWILLIKQYPKPTFKICFEHLQFEFYFLTFSFALQFCVMYATLIQTEFRNWIEKVFSQPR